MPWVGNAMVAKLNYRKGEQNDMACRSGTTLTRDLFTMIRWDG